MKLKEYDGKYVCILDTDGNSFLGRAKYGNVDFLECEWGFDEDGIFIEDVFISNSQIASIKEIIPHGTIELWTDHLILRRYRLDDVKQLSRCLGIKLEITQEIVQRLIDNYNDDHSYSWIMDANGDDVIVGTIGAYDYIDNQIKVTFSIGQAWIDQGFAIEALKIVLEYLTKNEGINCVIAFCAADDTQYRKVLENSGMQLVGIENNSLSVDDKTYDKAIYKYRQL